MFERLKKAFAKSGAPMAESTQDSAVSEWARTKGMAFTATAGLAGGHDRGFTLTGFVVDKPWKLECGKSSRDYIRGDEIRAKAETDLSEDVSILIMNRSLKEALEKGAYEIYTDSLQTTADHSLTEEMRRLAMYPEVRWDGLTPEFWKRYSILAEKRDQAMAWVDAQLATLLMNWPDPAPNLQVPLVLMILRGKVYLRMQHTPADMPTLQHATQIFTHACESGVSGLTTDIAV